MKIRKLLVRAVHGRLVLTAARVNSGAGRASGAAQLLDATLK